MRVEVVSAEPAAILAVAGDIVEQWRFDRDWEGTFDIEFRVHVDSNSGSCHTPNALIRLTGVTHVDVTVPAFIVCDPTSEIVQSAFLVRDLDSRLVCDCRERVPLAGAQVRVVSRPDPTAVYRAVRTDNDGRFRVSGLPDGTYFLSAEADGYASRKFTVQIDRKAPATALEFALVPSASSEPRPATVVRRLDLPIYPADALTRALEGEVALRLSMDGDEVVDIDAPADLPDLSRAARASVGSWVLSKTVQPVISVVFKYRLLPGDCTIHRRQQQIIMRLPSEVEIVEKRSVPCSPRP